MAMSKRDLKGRLLGIDFLDEDKILFRSDDWICLWTMASMVVSDDHDKQNVQLLYKIPPDTDVLTTWVQDIHCISPNQFIFITKTQEYQVAADYEMRTFDVRTQSLRPFVTINDREMIDSLRLVGTTGRKWLVFWARGNQARAQGLHVYNLETKAQVDFCGGIIGDFTQPSAAQCMDMSTFCTLDGIYHNLIAWSVDEESGQLSQRALGKIHSSYNNSVSTHLLAASEPHVLIEKNYGEVNAYSMTSGKAERHFPATSYAHHQAAASTIRNEWYLTDSFNGIYVYCHSEPHIYD